MISLTSFWNGKGEIDQQLLHEQDQHEFQGNCLSFWMEVSVRGKIVALMETFIRRSHLSHYLIEMVHSKEHVTYAKELHISQLSFYPRLRNCNKIRLGVWGPVLRQCIFLLRLATLVQSRRYPWRVGSQLELDVVREEELTRLREEGECVHMEVWRLQDLLLAVSSCSRLNKLGLRTSEGGCRHCSAES